MKLQFDPKEGFKLDAAAVVDLFEGRPQETPLRKTG